VHPRRLASAMATRLSTIRAPGAAPDVMVRDGLTSCRFDSVVLGAGYSATLEDVAEWAKRARVGQPACGMDRRLRGRRVIRFKIGAASREWRECFTRHLPCSRALGRGAALIHRTRLCDHQLDGRIGRKHETPRQHRCCRLSTTAPPCRYA